ncbi:MAG: hypothetical protein KDD69_09085 [Bdellovibrionales bacterium]|nr:hypothetical protein [Bdellovibrionales bacterium]
MSPQSDTPGDLPPISAEQVANYVVCPEAWRLKHLENASVRPAAQRPAEGRRRRSAWVQEQDLSKTLRDYAKVVYLLTVVVVILVFLFDIKRNLYPKDRTRPNRALEAPHE